MGMGIERGKTRAKKIFRESAKKGPTKKFIFKKLKKI